jgi:hypothetical protein
MRVLIFKGQKIGNYKRINSHENLVKTIVQVQIVYFKSASPTRPAPVESPQGETPWVYSQRCDVGSSPIFYSLQLDRYAAESSPHHWRFFGYQQVHLSLSTIQRT